MARAGQAILNKLNATYKPKFQTFIDELKNQGMTFSAFKKHSHYSRGGKVITIFESKIGKYEVEVHITNKGEIYQIFVNEKQIVDVAEASRANYKKEADDLVKLIQLESIRNAKKKDLQAEKKAKQIHKESESKKQKKLDDLIAKRDNLKKEVEELQSQIKELQGGE
jgi:hypothetical protein